VVLQTGQAATFTSDSTPGSSLSWTIDGVAFGGDRSVTYAFADPGFHVVLLKATLNGERDFAVSVFGVNSPLYPVPLQPPTPKLMSHFPTVRLVGNVVGRGASITLLAVRGAPHVARVTVRCTGGGCPFRSRRRTATTGRVGFSKWPRVLVAGARIERFRLRDELAFAGTADEQADAAQRLAMAYGRAADHMVSPGLVSAAQDASVAYLAVESAARARDQDAYDSARARVEAAEKQIESELAQINRSSTTR
jgi:hypothetical protein